MIIICGKENIVNKCKSNQYIGIIQLKNNYTIKYTKIWIEKCIGKKLISIYNLSYKIRLNYTKKSKKFEEWEK